MTAARPDVDSLLATLKPFQRDTVDHAFARLWTDPDRTPRFLVADEVGLGKTLIARGVAARAIDHLWSRCPEDGPITILYICSNSQIAQQNLSRLSGLTDGHVQSNADRLTLLPLTMSRQESTRVEMLAFTPGTSLDLGYSTGKAAERQLGHVMLEHVLGGEPLQTPGWIEFFRVSAGAPGYKAGLCALRDELEGELHAGVMERFRTRVTTPLGEGPSLAERFKEEHDRAWSTKAPDSGPTEEALRKRRELIGDLRLAMAYSAIESLAPDLVILDEFQRFKDLFDERESGVNPAARELAGRLLKSEETRTLVLSATPFKMYTLPDEPEGEDHYEDFRSTVRFLASGAEADAVLADMARIRRGLRRRTPESLSAAVTARDDAGARLRKVMCRTERVSYTAERDGMVEGRVLGDTSPCPEDIRGWRMTDAVRSAVDGYDMFELWRSAPYLPNLMDRSYKVQTHLLDALESGDTAATDALRHHAAELLDWPAVDSYQPIPLPNAKLRALVEDLDRHKAWNMAWLPPALPYLKPSGVFADPAAQAFTKRLVFSSWTVVPKAIATLVSNEAERRVVKTSRAARNDGRHYTDRRPMQALAFSIDRDTGLPRNLPHLIAIYPSQTLARLGDPLQLARAASGSVTAQDARTDVAGRVRAALARANVAPVRGDVSDRRRSRWYGVAPLLLDALVSPSPEQLIDAVERVFSERTAENTTEDVRDSAMAAHLRWAAAAALRAVDGDTHELGDPPEDLAEVLAEAALGGAGICALRALSRGSDPVHLDDPGLVGSAAHAAVNGLRPLFRRPEVMAVVKTADPSDANEEDAYWRQVLRYSMAGNLQAVLDEYIHTLIESEGLSDRSPAFRWAHLSERIVDVAGLQVARATVEDIRPGPDGVVIEQVHMRTHLAARFGGASTSDGSVIREALVRHAYTSPFWPFVLASTSVGQEGLDFHTYSHAVVHWNLPGNPVDLEQREGRVHRYKGHAVRKNVAAAFGQRALARGGGDVWSDLFAVAEESDTGESRGLSPAWLFPGNAKIWRFVPALPLSREKQRYGTLQRTLGAYRMTLGQPRQEELVRYAHEVGVDLTLDLRPIR